VPVAKGAVAKGAVAIHKTQFGKGAVAKGASGLLTPAKAGVFFMSRFHYEATLELEQLRGFSDLKRFF